MPKIILIKPKKGQTKTDFYGNLFMTKTDKNMVKRRKAIIREVEAKSKALKILEEISNY